MYKIFEQGLLKTALKIGRRQISPQFLIKTLECLLGIGSTLLFFPSHWETHLPLALIEVSVLME